MTTMNRRTLLQTSAAALAASLASGRMAFAQTNDTVNILALAPLTGPVAFTGEVEQRGWLDSQDWINANGGIAGRKLNVVINDTEYKVDVGLAAWKRGIADGKYAFVKSDNTGLARAMAPENADRYKMLIGMSAQSSSLTDTKTYPQFFLPAPNYKDLMEVLLTHIAQQNPGKKPRIALVYSATEFGRDPIEHTKQKIAQGPFELVLEDETPFTAVDVTPNAIKLRNARPDYVLFHGYAANVWPEISRLAREYRVQAQFMVTSFACDPNILRSVGESANGVIGVVPHSLALAGSDKPMLKVIHGYMTKRDPNYGGIGNIGYMFAWANALVFREIATKCLQANQELNGPNLIKALESLKDWDSGGIFAKPVTFREHRVPSAILYRFGISGKDVKMEHISDIEI